MDAARVLAVAVADVRTRLRRPGTGVLVLASAFGAWLAIPDPATGAGLLQIGGARALYTSPALAFATAALFAFPLSLFGFYLVSNALERDVRARMATVVAASPVGNAEYLLGKLAGNLALLARRDPRLPGRGHGDAGRARRGPARARDLPRALRAAPGSRASSGWRRWRSSSSARRASRAGSGDVVYFFVWMTTLTLGAEPWRKAGAPASWLGRCLDYTGLGFVIREIARQRRHLGVHDRLRARRPHEGAGPVPGPPPHARRP